MYTQRSVLCVRHLKEVSMLTAFNWLERGYLEPNNLDGASLLNVLKRYKNSDQQYGRLVQFHKNRFHFLMRVAVGYSSRLLETKPFLLSMAFQDQLLFQRSESNFYLKLFNWSLRALYLFQIARRLYSSKQKETKVCGPLVDELRAQGFHKSITKHEEEEALEEGKELFAVVAGIRRQTACAILNLIQALGFDRTWGMPAEAKPVVKLVSQQMT